MDIKNGDIGVIGSAPDDIKMDVLSKVMRMRFDHTKSVTSNIPGYSVENELPKTEKQVEIIKRANHLTNSLMERLGFPGVTIPLDNFHLVSSKTFRDFQRLYPGNGNANTVYTKQGMIFDMGRINANLIFGLAIYHELLHLKGCFITEANLANGVLVLTSYREGVSVNSLQNSPKHTHFRGLHEAIVATQEKISFRDLIESPIFLGERKNFDSPRIKSKIQQIASARDISENEIAWVTDEGKEVLFPYKRHRDVLEYVCEEICKRYSYIYNTSLDVFDEFLKAHFSGNILTIGKLVEKTFGVGSFRLLGNMETDAESANLHLESLKRLKSRQDI